MGVQLCGTVPVGHQAGIDGDVQAGSLQGGPAELAEKAILRFAGAENAYVAPAADGLRASLDLERIYRILNGEE